MNADTCVAVAVYVVRRHEGAIELLFLHRSGGQFAQQWWPITGKREHAEDPGQCAMRELEEETGLTPSALYQTDITAPVKGGGYLRIFVAPVDAAAAIHLNWEHDAHRWCSPEEAHAIVGRFPEPIVETIVRIFETQPKRRAVIRPEPLQNVIIRAEGPEDQQQIHRVVVVDEQQRPVGILSSLDLVACMVVAIED